jgi:23S rRNA (guanosine2251-2'-O)-methyltransferase
VDDHTRLPYSATSLSAPYSAITQLPVTVVLDNIRSTYNVGAFFRTCDATRVERLCLCGITAAPPHKGVAKTALGAEERVRWERHRDAADVIDGLHQTGYELAAIETSIHAVDLFDWRARFPVALLFGNEIEGVSRALLERCDTHVRIPMLGIKHSLNVATAGGVVLYELLRKYRALSEQRGSRP